jgi:GNAT superfamily N-acetyltransferase
MSKASKHIDDLVAYFGFAGGVVRGGSLADLEVLMEELKEDSAVAVGRQLQRNLDKVKHGRLLVAEGRVGHILGAALGYEQDDCWWVCDVVSSKRVRGTGTALMQEFARRALEAGKELRLEALRDSGSLSFFDMLGARTTDHYNKRALGWNKAGLATLAGTKQVEAMGL